ncbi:MAG: lytic murein transglycosylase, partial [Xanthobacteraceae bacterium]
MRIALLALMLTLISFGARADAAFTRWLEQLYPAARERGVSRATFDAAARGLEPDLTLPDLLIPGRPDRQPAQAEFMQTPAEYLK